MKQFAARLALGAFLLFAGVAAAQSNRMIDLSDAQMENLVRRSYQYVAMFQWARAATTRSSPPPR
jgi:DNA-binding IclR family transcriptional regulator